MFYLIIVSIIWALSFSLIKGELTSIDSNLIAFLRLSISFLIFLPFIKINHLKLKTTAHLLTIGIIQYGLMYSAYIYSFQYLMAYEIAIMTIFTPIFVVLFYDIWNRKIIKTNWQKAALAVIGSAIVVYSNSVSLGFWKGILLIQLSNALFAFGQIYYKKIVETHKIHNQKQHFAVLFAGGALITGIFSFYSADITEISLSQNQILIILYLAIVASGLGFFLWNFGVSKVEIGRVAILNNLKIPLGVFFALLILNESVNLFQFIIGSMLIICAFFLEKITPLNK